MVSISVGIITPINFITLPFAANHSGMSLVANGKLFVAHPLLSPVTEFVIGVELCYLLKRSSSL